MNLSIPTPDLLPYITCNASLSLHHESAKRMFEIEALDPPKATAISPQISSSSLSDFPFKSTSDVFEDEPDDLTQITDQ